MSSLPTFLLNFFPDIIYKPKGQTFSIYKLQKVTYVWYNQLYHINGANSDQELTWTIYEDVQIEFIAARSCVLDLAYIMYLRGCYFVLVNTGSELP